jgi:hypothetical protein
MKCGGCGYREAISHHEPGLCLCKHPATLDQKDQFVTVGRAGVWYVPRNVPAKEGDKCRHGYNDIWAAIGAARLMEFLKGAI